MARLFAIFVLALLVLPFVTPTVASAQRVYTPDDTLAALADASPLAWCIAQQEVGNGTLIYAPWDPNSIGKAQEKGVFQLHPQGMLPAFYARGYTDWTNPWQQVEFFEDAVARGEITNWPTRAACMVT